ncbi:MAG: 1-acyl-sn-glycerol-3-phosphate acyltransferase, partial [Nocardioidaceae bacterium]
SALLEQTIKAYPDHEEGAWWMPRSHGGKAPTPELAEKLDADEKRQRAEKRRADRQAKKKQ